MAHIILFSGHMIDDPKRKESRFPPEKEPEVAAALAKLLAGEKEMTNGTIKGIASGASGGDILFHEACQKLNIETEMYLALPVNEFMAESVSFAGKDWEKRFDKLTEELPVHILPENKSKNKQNVWEQTNLWMLEKSIESGSENVTLIALWNMKEGDGAGGTEGMVKQAKEKGVKTITIDITKIMEDK